MKTTMKLCLAGVMLVLCGPTFAASKTCETPAEVEFTRVSAEGRRVNYSVSIRHYAPTELANVGWDYIIHYRGTDGRDHFIQNTAGHSTARRRDSLSAYDAAQAPRPPIAEITHYEIRRTVCYY